MPVWCTRPVSEQGELALRNWKVLQLPNGERHLIGYCVENREGRVSSVVREIDYGSLTAVTRAGRKYVLHGLPGVDLDAQHVWKRGAAFNAVRSWEDVTCTVWSMHESSRSQVPR